MADVLLRLGQKYVAVRSTDLHRRTLQLLADSCYPSVSTATVLREFVTFGFKIR